MNKKLVTPVILAVLFLFTCVGFTGCGNANNADETPMEEQSSGNDENSMTNENMDETATDNLGQDAENVGDAIMDGVEDVADDLTDIDFTDYNSSHDYLLDQIAGDGGNQNKRYVVKEENREAVNYLPEDASRKGYCYHVYDTTSDTEDRYGVFYVDNDTGKIYRENSTTKKAEEYKAQ